MLLSLLLLASTGPAAAEFSVGCCALKITPTLQAGRPVWLAGFGQHRSAEGIRDDLWVRAMVISDGGPGLAIVSLDLIGLFNESVTRIRERLGVGTARPVVDDLLVACTHTHSAPDTIGIWGPNNHTTGVDRVWVDQVLRRTVEAVETASRRRVPARLFAGCGKTGGLTGDSRKPLVLDESLGVLQARTPRGRAVATVVNWANHPEALGKANRRVSSDFCHRLIAEIESRTGAPAIFLNGAIGGLVTPLGVPLRDPVTGRPVAPESGAHADRIGTLAALEALNVAAGARELRRQRLELNRSTLHVPMENPVYRAALAIGVIERQVFSGDAPLTGLLGSLAGGSVRTEIGIHRIGELVIGAVPGELYPELAVGTYQEPQDPAADFPGARREPALRPLLESLAGSPDGPRCAFVVGLANDEIGYIIPRSQWDDRAPYCYGRSRSQYGEGNSLGPRTAPILMEAFQQLAKTVRPAPGR
ncbi:MAG: hypothetical protein HY815_29120 [Candidatus Riflebacteria bacterium]|nr:hypothetical protein [Candidatus Riflebacteria bacterium]